MQINEFTKKMIKETMTSEIKGFNINQVVDEEDENFAWYIIEFKYDNVNLYSKDFEWITDVKIEYFKEMVDKEIKEYNYIKNEEKLQIAKTRYIEKSLEIKYKEKYKFKSEDEYIDFISVIRMEIDMKWHMSREERRQEPFEEIYKYMLEEFDVLRYLES